MKLDLGHDGTKTKTIRWKAQGFTTSPTYDKSIPEIHLRGYTNNDNRAQTEHANGYMREVESCRNILLRNILIEKHTVIGVFL